MSSSTNPSRLSLPLLVCTAAAGVAIGALVLEPSTSSPSFSSPSTEFTPSSSAGGYGSTSETVEQQSASELQISDFKFVVSPVPPGSPVAAINRDEVEHTVTSNDGGFDVSLSPQATGDFTSPSTPGTYTLFCRIHPTMSGQLTVS